MCIVCNLGDKANIADDFLAAFVSSSHAMREAADGMLACSKNATLEADRKRYDKMHKTMVKQLREWNRLEEKREHG